MSDLDDFLNNRHDEADAVFGTQVLTVGATTFPVVWNSYRLGLDGVAGGLEEEKSGTATAQPSDVSDAVSLIGKRCTLAGETFRIGDVRPGAVAIHFDLIGEAE